MFAGKMVLLWNCKLKRNTIRSLPIHWKSVCTRIINYKIKEMKKFSLEIQWVEMFLGIFNNSVTLHTVTIFAFLKWINYSNRNGLVCWIITIQQQKKTIIRIKPLLLDPAPIAVTFFFYFNDFSTFGITNGHRFAVNFYVFQSYYFALTAVSIRWYKY